jgi:hypothetical protein
LVVAGASGHVEELLEPTHLNRLVGMYPDAGSAHRAMAELPSVPRP